jgi:endoglycosylceramidase
MKAFDALYENKNGLQDKFVEFWDATSKFFTGNPYVIGYDPINEPYPGNTLRRPDLLLPGAFDRKRLQPMYERVFERYYKNSAETIMYFEPATFPDVTNFFGGRITKSGFTEPPGASYGSPNHVLNDHTYCC